MKSLITYSSKNSIELDINSTLTPMELFTQLFKTYSELFAKLFGAIETEMMRCDIKTLNDVHLALVDSEQNLIYEYESDEPIFCGLSELCEIKDPSYKPVFLLRDFEFCVSTCDNCCYKDEYTELSNDILSKITSELAINGRSFSFAPGDNKYFRSWDFSLNTDASSKGYSYDVNITHFPYEDEYLSAIDVSFTYRSEAINSSELYNRIAMDIATDKIGVSNNIKVTLEACPNDKFHIKMTTSVELLDDISYDKLGINGFDFDISVLEEYIAEIKK